MLSKALSKKLIEQGNHQLYPIQEKAIPLVLKRKDVLGIAPTGSGKTLAFVLPIIQMLGDKEVKKSRAPEALILAPTRELVQQIVEVFKEYGTAAKFPLKPMGVHGGVSINPQMKALFGVRVLVATPGRLLELLELKALELSKVEMLVLDEADKMLNLGFRDEMNRIMGLLPATRQNLLFSATLSEEVLEVQSKWLNQPEVIKIMVSQPQEEQLNQTGYFVSEEKKGPLLRHLIQSREMKQVLVFTSSVNKADKVVGKLIKNGIAAAAIHSKKSQGARSEVLSSFKSGKTPVLVTTDLLARGIDIAFLPFVINYELPRSPKDFIHRVGRTGRAENPGEAIVFVTPADKHHFKVIQKKMGRRIEMIDAENMDFKVG